MQVTSSPGRIGLTKINGEAGRLIKIGQYLNGDGFSDWEHAFLDLGDGTIIQAEPGGAQIRSLDIYAGRDVYWCDNIYATLTTQQKIDIACYAQWLAGTPYSFLDYEALLLHRLHVPAPGLRNYIASSRHLICSQLCDLAYQRAFVHLFHNRWNGYVTPGDLWKLDKYQSRPVDLSHPKCGICGLHGFCSYPMCKEAV